jgi:hypothetical protein
MSNKVKGWLIAATCLILGGALLFGGIMTALHWDFTALSTERYQTKTYTFNEKIENIRIDTDTADVRFAVAADGQCKIVCEESVKEPHRVELQGKTLTVQREDFRRWFDHIGINFKGPHLTVYLPAGSYASLVSKSSTGDLSIVDGFDFEKVDITVSTGDVSLSGLNCGRLTTNGSTGNVTLKNVVAERELIVKRSTGDVRLERCDASEIEIKTDTGDIEITIANE